jgi:hypothetical protein
MKERRTRYPWRLASPHVSIAARIPCALRFVQVSVSGWRSERGDGVLEIHDGPDAGSDAADLETKGLHAINTVSEEC